jgi:hypothetical protein
LYRLPDGFPLPPFLPHAVADFYILHAGHYLDYFIIFFRVQIEKFTFFFSSSGNSNITRKQ